MGLVLLVVSLILFNVLVTSILYHRSLTHRSVTFNRWLARAMTVYMQGMAFAPPLTWVATHRLHHSDTDTSRDPYSPRVHGFLAVLVGTPVLVGLWRRRNGRARVERLTRGMPDAAFFAFCEWRPFCLAVTGAFIVGFVLIFGWLGVPLFIGQLVGFYLMVGWENSAGHTFGERPFAGSATNHRRGWLSSVLNVCLWGECLHNYHHRFPTRANFGVTGELDAGYLVCRLLARLGLASMRTT